MDALDSFCEELVEDANHRDIIGRNAIRGKVEAFVQSQERDSSPLEISKTLLYYRIIKKPSSAMRCQPYGTRTCRSWILVVKEPLQNGRRNLHFLVRETANIS